MLIQVPLPRWGQMVMGCIYFSVPVVGGWYVMQWAIGKAHDSIGEKGEKLEVKEIQGLGNQRIVTTSSSEDGEVKVQRIGVGAGGLGMGVKLAMSDDQDQQNSKKMLEKMLKKARKEKLKREKETNVNRDY